jgi:hypothetical protein
VIVEVAANPQATTPAKTTMYQTVAKLQNWWNFSWSHSYIGNYKRPKVAINKEQEQKQKGHKHR